MRMASCLLFAFAATVLAAAPQAKDPAPLLKPVVPSSTGVRIRVPVVEDRAVTMQFKGQVPKARGKKGDLVDVTVGIETLPGPSFVSTKLWESWGYETPPSKMVVLPELTILGTQLAPKLSKGGRDVQAKVSGIRLEVIDPPGESEKVRGCDIYLTLRDLTRGAYAAYEPRFYFPDKFFELTVPAGTVKRPGTGEEPPADPAVTDDPALVIFAGKMVAPRGIPVFAYAAVNSMTQYTLPDGKIEPVAAGVSSTNDWPTGVLLTMGTARGCKVELDPEKEEKGVGANFETRVVLGRVKELRLGVMTGSGLKTPRDIVIKDLKVYVDKSNSGHFVWLGPKFLDTYFKDSVYNCGPDSSWALHGRLNPELLQDIKTRPKKQ